VSLIEFGVDQFAKPLAQAAQRNRHDDGPGAEAPPQFVRLRRRQVSRKEGLQRVVHVEPAGLSRLLPQPFTCARQQLERETLLVCLLGRLRTAVVAQVAQFKVGRRLDQFGDDFRSRGRGLLDFKESAQTGQQVLAEAALGQRCAAIAEVPEKMLQEAARDLLRAGRTAAGVAQVGVDRIPVTQAKLDQRFAGIGGQRLVAAHDQRPVRAFELLARIPWHHRLPVRIGPSFPMQRFQPPITYRPRQHDGRR